MIKGRNLAFSRAERYSLKNLTFNGLTARRKLVAVLRCGISRSTRFSMNIGGSVVALSSDFLLMLALNSSTMNLVFFPSTGARLGWLRFLSIR